MVVAADAAEQSAHLSQCAAAGLGHSRHGDFRLCRSVVRYCVRSVGDGDDDREAVGDYVVHLTCDPFAFEGSSYFHLMIPFTRQPLCTVKEFADMAPPVSRIGSQQCGDEQDCGDDQVGARPVQQPISGQGPRCQPQDRRTDDSAHRYCQGAECAAGHGDAEAHPRDPPSTVSTYGVHRDNGKYRLSSRPACQGQDGQRRCSGKEQSRKPMSCRQNHKAANCQRHHRPQRRGVWRLDRQSGQAHGDTRIHCHEQGVGRSSIRGANRILGTELAPRLCRSAAPSADQASFRRSWMAPMTMKIPAQAVATNQPAPELTYPSARSRKAPPSSGSPDMASPAFDIDRR